MRDLIDLIENTLMEMIIRHQSSDPKYIVAFQDSIWLLDDNTPEQVYREIEQKTGIEADDISSLEDEKENRPDVLLAYYDDVPTLDGITIGLNPRTSLLLKKVAQQLNLDGFNIYRTHGEEESNQFVGRYQSQGKIPRTAYHGTSTAHILKILRQGLRPDTDHGNWLAGVEHIKVDMKFSDRIFIASDPEFTYYHANRAAELTGGRPVVIELTIPDMSKIDYDYDVATQFKNGHETLPDEYINTAAASRNSYGNNHLPDMIDRFTPKTNYTRETGVMSFRGRIPASFIEALLLPNAEGEIGTGGVYRETDFAQFINNLEYFTEYDMGYDPIAFEQMQDEMIDDEEEDDWDPTADLDDDD